MSGAMDKAMGKAKEAVGDMTDDDKLKAEGKTDQAAGGVKDKVDDAKDFVDDKVDDLKDR
jgi:uncharacterized protein YjbJ (UPF0337 family)